MAFAALGLILASGSLPATRAQATNPPYLRQFPSVERVKAEIKGTDAMETAARQMGAFWRVQQIIKDLSGFLSARNEQADEKRLLGAYNGSYQAAAQPYQHVQNSSSHPDKQKCYQTYAFDETDDAFLDSLFERFLSPTLRNQYFSIAVPALTLSGIQA